MTKTYFARATTLLVVLSVGCATGPGSERQNNNTADPYPAAIAFTPEFMQTGVRNTPPAVLVNFPLTSDDGEQIRGAITLTRLPSREPVGIASVEWVRRGNDRFDRFVVTPAERLADGWYSISVNRAALPAGLVSALEFYDAHYFDHRESYFSTNSAPIVTHAGWIEGVPNRFGLWFSEQLRDTRSIERVVTITQDGQALRCVGLADATPLSQEGGTNALVLDCQSSTRSARKFTVRVAADVAALSGTRIGDSYRGDAVVAVDLDDAAALQRSNELALFGTVVSESRTEAAAP